MKPKDKVPADKSAPENALPPPSRETLDLASRVANLLERLADASTDVADAGNGFRSIETRLRDVREQHEASRKRNIDPAAHARSVALIAEAERELNEAEARLISADGKRTTTLAQLADIRGQLEAAWAGEAKPMFEAARRHFLGAVDALTASWINLSAAAEAANLELDIRPSVQSPIGHEVLANSKVLGPKVADAVGEDWRTIHGVVNRARCVD
jgi:chromosome segregation ATPase